MKPASKSRTLWLNRAAGVLTAGLVAAEVLLPSMRGEVSPWVYAGIAIALAMANHALRYMTTEAIK